MHRRTTQALSVGLFRMNNDTTTEAKERALAQIVELAQMHNLSVAEVSASLKGLRPAGSLVSTSSHLLSYIGGILILSGIGVATGMFWGDMNAAMRILISFGVGVSCYLAAFVFHHNPRFRAMILPLNLLAVLLQPGGFYVVMYELSGAESMTRGLSLGIFSVLCLQQAVTYLVRRRGELLFFALVFANIAYCIAVDIMRVQGDMAYLGLGVSQIAVALVLHAGRHGAFAPFWNFWGSLVFYSALFDIVKGTYFEFVFLGAAVLLLALSGYVQSRSLLWYSSLAALSYIGYFSFENFADSVGWPIVLIFLGLVFLGMSSVVLRLSRSWTLSH